jgi:hypothetical protein
MTGHSRWILQPTGAATRAALQYQALGYQMALEDILGDIDMLSEDSRESAYFDGLAAVKFAVTESLRNVNDTLKALEIPTAEGD